MTTAAGTVAVNKIYEGLRLMVLSIMIKIMVACSKTNVDNSRLYRVQLNPYPVYDQNGRNLCLYVLTKTAETIP